VIDPRAGSLPARTRSVVKQALGSLPFGPWDRMRPDELLVAYYHETPTRHLDGFRAQVQALTRRARAIPPAALDDYYDGALTDGPYVLFTFDDGFASNLGAAAVLEQFGTRGLFFVVADFVDTDPAQAEEYVCRHIRPDPAEGQFRGLDEWRAATWAELRELRARGHEIGSHSTSHWFRAGELTPEAARREIVGSRDAIARGLECAPADVRCFAAPVDVARSVGPRELEMVRATYRYLFSTYPGTNRVRQRFLVRRCNVEVGWAPSLVRFSTRPLTAVRGRRRIRAFEDAVGGTRADGQAPANP
jgi:peptidoglycan/xylan/chitin deacetylase (PgdA/CDA1 family)